MKNLHGMIHQMNLIQEHELMQNVEVVIAPSLLTEGKVYQKAQQLGMGK